MGSNNDIYPRPDAGEMLLRLARGEVDAATVAWLVRGAQAWIEARGEIDVGRALNLPASPGRLVRDFHLAQAADALRATGSYDVAGDIASEWSTFISRGPWRRWRDAGGPPDDASLLRRALFDATRASRGRTLCKRQIANVLRRRNFPAENLPQQRANIPSWRLVPITEIENDDA